MKIEGSVRFGKGQIVHLDNFISRLEKFIELNDGKYGTITIDTIEKAIRYHRHQYYRGYLVPAIAIESFDGNERLAHVEMKRMFAYHEIESLADIPKKHWGKCIIEYDSYVTGDGEVLKRPIGYMPSMGTFTDKEAKMFILKVEAFAINDLQVSFGEEEGEAIYHRNKGLELEERP